MNNNECSICLEKIENDDDKTILSCNHVYHTSCIKTSIEYNNKCPYCRSFIEKIEFSVFEEDSLGNLLTCFDTKNIKFTGYRYIECPHNHIVKIPLFLQENIINEFHELSEFIDILECIEEEHLNELYSWMLDVIKVYKEELDFRHTDNIIILQLLYILLKKYPRKIKDYQLMACTVLFKYIPLIYKKEDYLLEIFMKEEENLEMVIRSY